MRPPNVKSMYIGSGTPSARPDSAQVDVFLRSEPPSRPYASIGEVEVSTLRESRSMEEMLTYARQEARKMGGDALIVESGSTGTSLGTYPVRNLYTGQVMYYRNLSGTLRTVKGAVIVWK
jgi:hypothetical protein